MDEIEHNFFLKRKLNFPEIVKKTLLYGIPLLYAFILLFQVDLFSISETGRHIKMGEIITHCLCIPHTNTFSYTNPAYPWVQDDWLSQVIFYLSYTFFGLNSLLI